MKKVFLATLALLLVFAVSCKNEPAGSNGSGGGAGNANGYITVDKEAGKEALIAQGAVENSRSLGPTGFSIKAKFTITENDGTEDTYINFGGKDGLYWIDVHDSEKEQGYLYFYEDSHKKFYYDSDEGDWVEIGQQNADLSLRSMFTALADTFLYSAYRYNSHFVKNGSTTKSGRACTRYTFSESNGAISMTFNYYVDDVYGITLAQDFSASAGGDNGSYTFELLEGTRFENVSKAVDLPAGHPDYPDLY